MRLGVLGGTFDPPHMAHLIFAELAREQLALERVLWVPAADPPHKQGQQITPIKHRVAMLTLALAGNTAFELSRVDVERPGPHYTADMLALIAAQHPGASLFLLIGADSLRDLPTWHDPGRIVAQAYLAVMPRAGVLCDLDCLNVLIPGLCDRVIFIDAPLLELSGSDIRARLAAGQTVRYMLPPGVEDYIHQHRLFRA